VNWLRNLFVLGSACFFAVMWGLVLRDKLARPPAPAMAPNYAGLLKEGQESRETRMGIYVGEKRIGSARTKIERTEVGGVVVEGSTQFELSGLSRYMAPVRRIGIEYFADISPLSGLRTFRLTSGALGTRLLGRVEGDKLEVKGTVSGQEFRREIPYERGTFFAQIFSPLTGLPDLEHAHVGDAWTLQMANPLLGSIQKVRVTLASQREVELKGERRRLCRLLFHVREHVWEAWVTEDEEILVQGSPFGFTLRREDISPEVLSAIGISISDEVRRLREE
jgi:hypothetical protein